MFTNHCLDFLHEFFKNRIEKYTFSERVHSVSDIGRILIYVTQEVARKQVPKDRLLSKVRCPNLVLGNAIFNNNNNNIT